MLNISLHPDRQVVLGGCKLEHQLFCGSGNEALEPLFTCISICAAHDGSPQGSTLNGLMLISKLLLPLSKFCVLKMHLWEREDAGDREGKTEQNRASRVFQSERQLGKRGLEVKEDKLRDMTSRTVSETEKCHKEPGNCHHMQHQSQTLIPCSL